MILKVCFLLPRLLPGKSGVFVGGCVTNCVALALELKEQGVSIELLAPVPEESREYLAGHPVQEILKPLSHIGKSWVGKGIGAVGVLRKELSKRIKDENYNIVHSHSGTFPYAAVPLAVNRKKAVRLHSLYCPIGANGGAYSSWWEKPGIARHIFNRLDRVIAVTGNIRQSIQRAGVSQQKIEFVSMGVDTQRFSPRSRIEPAKYFTNTNTGSRLLFIGNSSKEKGLVELLHSVKTLIQKKIEVSVVATIENQSQVSGFASSDKITQLVHDLGLTDHVRILGLVDDIETLYSESDLVVIPWNTTRGPSDYPMVALEAMAMEKCIVSTPVGGCSELLLHGKAGILTEGFSSEAVAASLEYAINHPDICQQKSTAALKAADDLSMKNSAKQIIAMYENLLRDKN